MGILISAMEQQKPDIRNYQNNILGKIGFNKKDFNHGCIIGNYL